jgi:hypothetical protein
MDPKLKLRLAKEIREAYEQRGILPLKVAAAEGGALAENANSVRENRNSFLQKTQVLVYRRVRRKLANIRLWKQMEAELAKEAVERFVAELVHRRERASEGPAQLSLPGFENLPGRVRSGREYLPFPKQTLTQFLSYKPSYEQRAKKDYSIIRDLERLAEKVERFAAEEPQLTVAEALRRTEPPALALVR